MHYNEINGWARMRKIRNTLPSFRSKRISRVVCGNFFISSALFFFVAFFCFGVTAANAAPIRILSNSIHAENTIGATIDQLLGTPYTSSQFVIDYTDDYCSDNTAIFAGFTPLAAIENTGQAYCSSLNGATTTPSFPYQMFTTSYTENPGDSVSTYNQFASNDITDNYAFTNDTPPAIALPTTLYTSPGSSAFASAAGVEWTLDPTVFCSSSLSCMTAANAGVMSWLRLEHPTWNWYDVKAAMRQNGTNWTTGYAPKDYGFGVVNATTTNELSDNQILLQPPEVTATTTGMTYGQITFTLFPFRQTRRAEDVLFEFPSNPGFQPGVASSSDLTLADIQAFGGTVVTDYSGSLATTTAPIFNPVSNAYFVWFTADSTNDTASTTLFSRIDTYSVLGPLSQGDINFDAFNLSSPANNAISTTPSPTFSWTSAATSPDTATYQLYIDGALAIDNISGTSVISTTTLSAGTHTWYIKALNSAEGATSSPTRTINIEPNYTSGTTFYVDNVLGNDNNPGTQSQPWATLTKAADTAEAGDTVKIVANSGVPYRETLTPLNNGTATAPITFEATDPTQKPEIWGSTDESGGWSIYSGGNADTYQKALATEPQVVAAGPSISALTTRVNGSSQTALNPGEWFWSYASSTLYYRLQSGEDITTLHIETATRNYDISASGHVVFKNIIVRYANEAGISIGENSIAQGIEAYDSYHGISVINEVNPTIEDCVAAGNVASGINSSSYGSPRIYNSLSYGNGGTGIYLFVLDTSMPIIENTVSSGNASYPFSVSYFTWSMPTSFITSNNSWDVAGDSGWNTFEGTNNQALVDPLFTSTSTRDFSLQQFSPEIGAGTNVGLTTDILGNPIYGTPDIGPYEYQPPYTITSGSVPINGSFRMYGNGKYRMLTATSSSATAHLTIAPPGGFPATDYSRWLDVTVNTWNTSGTYDKSWTATSSGATSIVQTIGDLAPNSWYTVSVDGTPDTTLESDANGFLAYTYAGGWSTAHTFSVSQAATSPATTLSSPSDNTTESGPVSLAWSWDTADGSAADIAKYQLYVDGALAVDNIAPTASSVTVPNTVSCNEQHTWYVQAVDNFGNASPSATRHLTISCGSIVSVATYATSPTLLIATTVPISPSSTTTESVTSSTSPTVSQASALTNPQIQSILSLLSSFGADSTTIAKVDAALTGIPSTSTNSPTAPSCSFTRDLTIGVQGSDVTCLQQALIKNGYAIPAGDTGYFGDETRAAVSAWQKAVGVTPTLGYFGPLSRRKWSGE